MAKIVIYNGGTQSYYGCSDPKSLIVGQKYEVVFAKDRGWQTDYTIKGIEGAFNSVWFDEIVSDDKVYMAVANTLPKIGEAYSCNKIVFVEGKPKLVCWSTTTVEKIKNMGNNIYHVTTKNSVYIVSVG